MQHTPTTKDAAPPHGVLYLIGSLQYGGAQTQLVELATNLDRQRFRPVVGVMSELQNASKPLRDAGIPVVRFQRRHRFDPTAVFAIAGYLRKHRIDILHTWLFSAGAVGRTASFLARGTVVVHTQRGFPEAARDGRSGKGAPLRTRLLNGVLRPRTDAVIANSSSLARYLTAVEGYDEAKTNVILNGVDAARVAAGLDARQRVRDELGIASGQTLVGTVANLTPPKNHLLFIEMAERLVSAGEDMVFVLVGDDVTGGGRHEAYRSSVSERLGSSPVRSRFRRLGYRADVPALLGALDVFVLTSDSESMPNVLLEAAAAGLPIVSTRSSDLASILDEEGGGIAVPIGDAGALAGAVRRLATDPAHARALGQRAQRLVLDKFSVERMAAATQDLYLRLLNGKPRSPRER